MCLESDLKKGKKMELQMINRIEFNSNSLFLTPEIYIPHSSLVNFSLIAMSVLLPFSLSLKM